MVLSFMILWDLPRIAGGVRSLETSRLSTVYAEVAPSVKVFGELFGRALQAQVKPGLAPSSVCQSQLSRTFSGSCFVGRFDRPLRAMSAVRKLCAALSAVLYAACSHEIMVLWWQCKSWTVAPSLRCLCTG